MSKRLWAVLAAGMAAGCAPADPDAIVKYGRDNSSGTYAYFKEHVLGDEDFAADVQTLTGTAAVINAVSKDRRAIGYGGIGYVSGVRALKVSPDGKAPAVEPSLENVVNGTYPISRFLYLYTVGEPEGAVKHFIEWAMSAKGQKVCEDVQYYPLPEGKRRPDPGSAPEGKASVTVKGSDTMLNLGQKWAEIYMKENPTVVLQITGGGSGTGIAALINGATDICQASRPIKDKERVQIREKHGKEAVEFAVALDGLAIFVNEASGLQEISIPDLKAIYTGKTGKWGEVGGSGPK